MHPIRRFEIRTLRTIAIATSMLLGPAVPGCLAGGADTGQDEPEDVGEAEDAITAGTNIALGKTATQSSAFAWGGGDAARAVDGNTSGAWGGGSVTHTGGEASPWWQVELGATPQLVGTVELYNRTDCCSDRLSDFRLLVSDDGSSWATFDHPGTAGARVSVAVNRSARFVKVQLDANGATRYLSLAEVRVLAPPNLAQGKLATQSSTSYSAYASRAVDGNTSGAWGDASITHTAAEPSPWWKVDLGSIQDVGTIEIFNRTDCCSERLSSFQVKVSNDSVSWQSWSFPGQAGSRVAIPIHRSARQIVVQLDDIGVGRYLSLAEVKVHAAANAAPSPGFLPTLTPTAPIGLLEGAFDVDAQGAAGYSIPIQVPPGIKGAEPRLSLGYKSSSGNGIAGMGWSIAGIPVITRCPRIVGQDGVRGAVNGDAGDRFCLDGQRLIAVSGPNGASGTHYRTEVESFSRVISHGTCGTGPCHFEVTDKSGNIALLGATADSRALLVGGSARVWALSSLTSPNGNYLTTSYTQDGGQLYPQQILYTMNAQVPSLKRRKVTFEYEARTDVERAYLGSTKITTARRLARVKTHIEPAQGGADVLVRDYRLAYAISPATKRSLVTSVTECDGLGVCLPATQLEYSSAAGFSAPGDNPFTIVQPAGAIYQNDLRHDPGALIRVGDLDGDGRSDFHAQQHAGWDDDLLDSFRIYRSNGDGTFDLRVPSSLPLQGTFRESVSVLTLGDWTGDGRMDYLSRGHNGWNNHFVWVSMSDGDIASAGESMTQIDHDPGAVLMTGDFDGDGKTDLLRRPSGAWENMYPQGESWIYRATGNGLFQKAPIVTGLANPDLHWILKASHANVFPGDFNGDGMTDILRQEIGPWSEDANENLHVLLSEGLSDMGNMHFRAVAPSEPVEGLPFQALQGGSFVILTPGDYNGDGKTDFIRQEYGECADDGNLTFQVYFSRGDGTFDVVTPTAYQASPAGDPYQQHLHGDHVNILPVDYNGDGKTDFIRQEHNDWDDDQYWTFALYISRGDGTFDILYPGQPGWGDWYHGLMAGDAAYIHPGDFDGDGKTDFLRQEHGGWDDDAVNTFQVFLAKGDRAPDTLKKVTNGLGGATTVQYGSLTDPALHTQVAGAPNQGPAFVVSAYQTTNGAGQPPVSFTYHYEGAKLDRTGRGFLGFSKIARTDQSLGSVTTVEHHQEFPLVGSIKRRTVGKVGTSTRVQTDNEYSTSYVGVYPSRVWTVTLAKETETHREGYSVRLAHIKEYVYDAFANPVIVRDHGDGQEEYASTGHGRVDTCTTYSGDVAQWRLDYPLYTRVGATCSLDANGMCACTQQKDMLDRYYDWTTMNVVSMYRWDDRYFAWVSTTLTHDALGNVLTRTLPGKTVAIVEKVAYDPHHGSFPVTLTVTGGALSQTSSFAYDPRSGVMTAQTDPSGNTSTWSVDGLGRVTGRSLTSPAGVVTPVELTLHGSDATGPYRETRRRNEWTTDSWRWEREYLEENGRVRRVVSQSSDVLSPDLKPPIVVDRTYDAAGEVAQESVPRFEGEAAQWQSFERDWAGRLTRVTDMLGTQTEILHGWDAMACYPCASKVTTIEARGTSRERAWTRHHDPRGRVRKQVDPEGRSVRYEYDLLGRRTKVEDDAGATTFVYDSLGRVATVTSPDRGTITSHYGVGHWLSSTQDARGVVTSYTYDDLGRVTAKVVNGSDADETTTFEYDNPTQANSLGRLTRAAVVKEGQSTPSSSDTFSYTPDGAIAGRTRTIDSSSYALQHAYDPQGRLRSTTFPDGAQLTRTYNPQGLLSRLAMGGVAYAQYSDFTAAGEARKVTYANGITTSYTFDAARRVESEITKGPGNYAFLRVLGYSWDPLHQLTQIHDQWRLQNSQTFTYSPSGQLVQAQGVYGTLSYGYDTSGNMTSKEGNDYSYSNHRVVQGTGFSATYDDAGNRESQTRNGVTTQLTWSGENRLTNVVQNGSTVQALDHDFAGERVKKVEGARTTHHVSPAYEVTIDGTQRLATKYVQSPSGLVAAVTTDTGPDGQAGQPTTSGAAGVPVVGTLYFHRDHIGSSSSVTNAQGDEVAYLEYKPYGEIVASASSGSDVFRSKFTGKERDNAADLYHFHARVYDPVTGRFLGADPEIQGGPAHLIPSSNPYAYAGNSPAAYTDPSGRAIAPVIVASVLLTAYAGGMATNGNDWNPSRWSWTSWQTWTGIGVGATVGGVAAYASVGVGGLAGAMLETAATSIAVNGMRFLSPEGSTWKDFLLGVSGEMATGAVGGSVMAGPRNRFGARFRERIAGKIAQRPTFGVVTKLVAKQSLDVATLIGPGILQEHAGVDVSGVLFAAATGANAPDVAGPTSPPPPQQWIDSSRVSTFVTSMADSILLSGGVADQAGRTATGLRERRRQPAAGPATVTP